MAAPVIRVEVDWAGDGMYAHAASDVSRDLMKNTLKWFRGRTLRSRLKSEAGKCTFSLWNMGGKYDPFNTGGQVSGEDVSGIGVRCLMDEVVQWTGRLDRIDDKRLPRPHIRVLALGTLAYLTAVPSIAAQVSTSVGAVARQLANEASVNDTYLKGAKALARWYNTQPDVQRALYELEEVAQSYLFERGDGNPQMDDPADRRTGINVSPILTLQDSIPPVDVQASYGAWDVETSPVVDTINFNNLGSDDVAGIYSDASTNTPPGSNDGGAYAQFTEGNVTTQLATWGEDNRASRTRTGGGNWTAWDDTPTGDEIDFNDAGRPLGDTRPYIVQVDSSLPSPGANYTEAGDLFALLVDAAADEVRLYRLGTSPFAVTQVGSDQSVGSSGFQGLGLFVSGGVTYALLGDAVGDFVRLYSVNTSTFAVTQVGSDISVSGILEIRGIGTFEVGGQIYALFVESADQLRLNTVSVNPFAIGQVGNDISIGAGQWEGVGTFVLGGSAYALVIDNQSNEARLYSINTDTFAISQVGSDISIGGGTWVGAGAFVVGSTAYALLVDTAADEVRLYTVNTSPFSMSQVNNDIDIGTGSWGGVGVAMSMPTNDSYGILALTGDASEQRLYNSYFGERYWGRTRDLAQQLVPLIRGTKEEVDDRFLYNLIYAPYTPISGGASQTLWSSEITVPANSSIVVNADFPTRDSAREFIGIHSVFNVTGTGFAITYTVESRRVRLNIANNSGSPNTATVTVTGTPLVGSDSLAVERKDDPSVARYGNREYPRPASLLSTLAEAEAYGDAVVDRGKDPFPWVLGLWPAHWSSPKARTVEISNRVTVINHGAQRDHFIEGIGMSMRNSMPIMEYVLSPVPGATVPSAPALIATSLGLLNPARFRADWTVPYDGGSSITGYELEYRIVETGSTWVSRSYPPGVLTATIRILPDDLHIVHVRIRAVNAIGAGPWAEAGPVYIGAN